MDDFDKKQYNRIFYGAPGTGKSYKINEITKTESCIRTTFHPDSDYASFVGAYKPTTEEVCIYDSAGHKIMEEKQPVKENKVVYKFVEQSFIKAYINAWTFYFDASKDKEPQKQFLIIEEINRGNCAQIFGDLFQLLDRNSEGFSEYPIEADKDLQKIISPRFSNINDSNYEQIKKLYGRDDIVTQVINGQILLLPNNLYIWASMNTSDQSLFPIDTAFKRRWDLTYVPIRDHKLGWMIKLEINAEPKFYDWWSFITKINQKIGNITNSEDKKLGYFFCKPKEGINIDADTFVNKVIFYLWNDVFKDYGFDDEIFVGENKETKIFSSFFITDGKDVRIDENRIDQLLTKLEVATSDVNTENSNEEENNADGNNAGAVHQNNDNGYRINDEVISYKTHVPAKILSIYIDKNPNIGLSDLINNWVQTGRIEPASIYTSEEYQNYIDRSRARGARTNAESRYDVVNIGNGEVIYVNNQMTPGKIGRWQQAIVNLGLENEIKVEPIQ